MPTRTGQPSFIDVQDTFITMARAPHTKSSTTPPTEAPPFDFEKAMGELEAVVERLEQGDIPLEEALASFERGVALTRACQEALATAEQKVEQLARDADGSEILAPFAGHDEDELP